MAKLYWRVKRRGKWTWLAATWNNTTGIKGTDPINAIYLEEEE